MDIAALFSPERIACEPEISSRKRAFEYLAHLLADGTDGQGAEEIFNALSSREKLGSTAIGSGVAIPHACMPVKEPRAAALLLEEGIKMDAPDKQPVRLFVAVLVPHTTPAAYAELIAQLARLLVQKSLLEQIHYPQENKQHFFTEFYQLFIPPPRFMGAMAA